jgi:hypothetical protein
VDEVSCSGGGGDRLCRCGGVCWGGGVRRLIGCETGGGVGCLRADCVTGEGGCGFLCADCVTGGGICDRVPDGPAPGVALGLFSRLIRRDSSIARRMFCASSSSRSRLFVVAVGALPIFSSVLSKPSVRPQL